jgi:hypothetical protein
MVKLGLSFTKDDILYNKTTIDSMQKSSTWIPFKGGQEIYVSTLGALIQACSFEGSLVVDMNSSIGSLFQSIWNLVFYFMFFAISHSYGMPLSLQEILFVPVSFLVIMFWFLNKMTMFMKRWSSPFYKKLDLKLILRCLPMALQIPHSRRDREWISTFHQPHCIMAPNWAIWNKVANLSR